MSRLQYRLEAAAARLAIFLLRRMGPAGASNFGGAIARSIGPLLPVTKVGDQNLRLAFPDMSADTRAKTLRAVWDNLGRVVGELPHVGNLRPTSQGPGWEVQGQAHIEAAATSTGPVIFFSAHIGNWEMLPAIAAHNGILLSNFYRAASNPLVDALITDLRMRAVGTDIPNFPKGAAGARAALAHLNKGGRLGMLVDQKMNDGISVNFFGRPAMTAPAGAAFALRYRCQLVPVHTERLGPARVRLIVQAPLALPDTGDRAADVASLTTDMNRCVEDWIRQRPGEWLWLHRRWPR